MRLFVILFYLLSPSAFAYSPLEIRDWADLLLRARDRPDELNDPALSGVTREFGPSVISLQNLPFDSDSAEADIVPWSSWWFPRIDRDLFDDGKGTSPFEKYDLVRAALTGKPSKAAALEKQHYSPDAPRWEGLCDAWAIASTIFPEPQGPRQISLPNGRSVTFSVGDQKALLLKTVDSVPSESLKIYGQRFTGNADGWIFPDLFPQELHRYVEVQLFQKHKLFVMDHDPGVEVWNEPVFKANYKITAVPGHDDAVFVRLWLFSAAPHLKKDQKDQPGMRELAREYDYFLYGKREGSRLKVEYGVWAKGDLVDSRRDHPDFVYSAPEPSAVKRLSRNTEIDSKIVDKILGR
ncbi:MAG TPA: hypothetical protein VIH99_00740 [Bdellovibrionota bacterium]|jgi:hypothetical protein